MLSIILSAIAVFIFAVLWFTALFGKLWARLMEFTPEQNVRMKSMGMTKSLIVNAIVNLVLSVGIFWLFQRVFVLSYIDLLRIVFIIWLAFTFPIYSNQVLWEGKSWKLLVLNSVYSILLYEIAATVIYYIK